MAFRTKIFLILLIILLIDFAQSKLSEVPRKWMLFCPRIIFLWNIDFLFFKRRQDVPVDLIQEKN